MLRWERPATEGPVPEARGGHTASLVGTDLIIFGGHYYGGDGKFVYLGDTCVLDMTTNMWHKVRTGGDEPAGRYGHSGAFSRTFFSSTIIKYLGTAKLGVLVVLVGSFSLHFLSLRGQGPRSTAASSCSAGAAPTARCTRTCTASTPRRGAGAR